MSQASHPLLQGAMKGSETLIHLGCGSRHSILSRLIGRTISLHQVTQHIGTGGTIFLVEWLSILCLTTRCTGRTGDRCGFASKCIASASKLDDVRCLKLSAEIVF
jgi:branched-subunit amino acid permease